METWLKAVIWVVYAITMFFFAFKPNSMGLGRPLVGLCGASLLVVLQDLAALLYGDAELRQDVEADVDYDIIIYLFALMIISHYFELTGLDRVPQAAFRWSKDRFGPLGLVWSVSLLTGMVAIFFTNDMAVFLLTPSVMRIVRDKNNPELHGMDLIFMMNLATNANLASSMSPIGNPQNVLVSSVGNISFGDFFSSIILAATVCWFLNTLVLSVWLYEHQGKIRIFGRLAACFRFRRVDVGANPSAAEPLLGAASDSSMAINSNESGKVVSSPAHAKHSHVAVAPETWQRSGASTPDNAPVLQSLQAASGPSQALQSDLSSSAARKRAQSHPHSRTAVEHAGPYDDDGHSLEAPSVKDPGRGREDMRDLVSWPGERAHRLAEEQGKAEMPPKVRTVLMITASLVFIMWIVMVATVPDLYLGWATLLTALIVMLSHEIALKVTKTPRVVNPGDAIFRVTDVIDFGLLFMFIAQFVLIGALLRTNVPQDLFTQLIGAFGADIVRLWFVMALLYAVIFASNILTNVPIILLLAPLINCLTCPDVAGVPGGSPVCLANPEQAVCAGDYPCELGSPRPVCQAFIDGETRYENYTAFIGWIIIAWAATIAGNLTLVGSAANLIVDSRARTVGAPELKFFSYLPFGFVTTMIFSFIGLILILLVLDGF